MKYYQENFRKMGLVISSAAKDTPYEVEVNRCMVEEMGSVRKDGIHDKDYLFYKDDMPTTLVMDEDEIALAAICKEAQALLSDCKAKSKKETSNHCGEINVTAVDTMEYSLHTKPRKKKKPQLSEQEKTKKWKALG